MSKFALIHAAEPLPTRLLAWAYSVGAPYHAAHGLAVDAPQADSQGDFQKEMLPRDWGIEKRQDLIAQLNRLGHDGHRRRHGMTLRYYAMLWRPRVAALREECLAALREGGEDADDMRATLWRLDAVQSNHNNLRQSPLLAFDAARAVMLARAGLMLQWLEPAEVWPYLVDVARDVQRSYGSWQDYGTDFVLSRNFWAGNGQADIFDEVVTALVEDASSPWQRLPWSTPLALPESIPDSSAKALSWSLE